MNKHLRKLVQKRRSMYGLNFPRLAELAGYRNTIKWANRICNFEREGVGEDDMIGRILDALKVDPVEVRLAVEKDTEEWETWADEPIPMQMIVHYFGAIIHIHKMPDEACSTREAAIDYGILYAVARKVRVCLIVSRRESVWISAEGETRVSLTRPGVPNFPYASIGGKKFIWGSRSDQFEPCVLKN